MNTPLDNAITAAAAAEATFTADQANVGAIQQNIEAAQAPLPAAQTQLAADAQAFNAALDGLSQAALAAKVSLQPTT